MAKHGNAGDERFQIRIMEEKYLNDSSKPNQPLSGKMGAVMAVKSGKGAKYWSSSFDQLEDSDTNSRLISQKLGLEYERGEI